MPSTSPDVMISAKDIHKAFGGNEVLRGVSLELLRGEVVAVIGPSGSGKSSFLRCLNHLETIDSGSIHIEGEVLAQNDASGKAQYVPEAQIRQIGRKMGMVFQSFNLFPHLTVLENLIEAPMLVKKMKREEIVPKAEALLAKVGLSAKRDAYPNRLSGGQKQRVAIARALAMQPRVLLMDEPFAALDALTRRRMQEELLALWEELRFTLVFVTHSIEEALVVGNRIAILSPHPGRVRAEVNSHQFDLSSQGSAEFQATAQRIHRLLFDEAQPQAEAAGEHPAPDAEASPLWAAMPVHL